jgi:hypothetical protein
MSLHRDFHLFPKLKEGFRGKATALIIKPRLQYTSGYGRKENTFLRTEFKSFLKVGKNVLKLEEIM